MSGADMSFEADMGAAVHKAQRAAKAWLGLVQFMAYDAPERKRTIRAEPMEDGEKPKILARIQNSSDSGYEAMAREVNGLFHSAEQALAMEWQKGKDVRHAGFEERAGFCDRFQQTVHGLVSGVLKAGKDVRQNMRPSSRERAAFAKLETALHGLVDVYDRHSYEETLTPTRVLLQESRGVV